MLVFRCTHSEAVDTLLYSSCYFPLPVLCIPWRETESALPKHFVFQGNAFWCILSDHFCKLLCIYFFILWFKYMKFTLFIFPGHITNQFNLERYSSIAEVRVWIPASLNCVLLCFYNCISFEQWSPYQAVTSKFYCLKQLFLPPATAWRFKVWFLRCDPIRFSQGNELILVYEKVIKYTQLLFLWATHFGKRTLKTL